MKKQLFYHIFRCSVKKYLSIYTKYAILNLYASAYRFFVLCNRSYKHDKSASKPIKTRTCGKATKKRRVALRNSRKRRKKKKMSNYVFPKQTTTLVNADFHNAFFTEIAIDHFGYEQLPPNTTKRTVDSSLPSFRLHFVQSGKIELSYQKERIILSKNSVFCLIPKSNICYKVIPTNEPTRFFWVSFEGLASKKILATTNISVEHPYAVLPNDDVLQYFCAVFAQSSSKYVTSFFSLLSNFFGIFSVLSQIANTAEPHFRNRQQQLINDAVSYIDDNFTNPQLTLSSVASAVHIHPNHLSRLFKSETQMTFIQYVTNKRIYYAVELIRRGFSNVQEIASLVGFNDSLYFSRVYKKYNMISPRFDILKIQKQHETET